MKASQSARPAELPSLTPSLQADAAYDAICDSGGLTRRQLAIWAGDRLGGSRPVFVEAGMIHLRGSLDPVCFRHAFQAVVDESDALRTAFEDEGGWPRQYVRPAGEAAVEVLDLTGRAAPTRALEDLALDRVATRVGVTRALYDAALVRMGRDHHVWIFAQHQLVSDAWSFGLLYTRTAEHYQRLRHGQGTASGAVPAFREYVEYERDFRASPRCAAARAYWQRRYAEAPRHAGARWSGASATTRTCRLAQPLGRSVTAALRTLADALGVSPDVGVFAVVAGVVAAYVHRSTGSRETVLSAPFANRPSARFKRTAGSFMNVCPVRVAIEAGDTWRGLIDRVLVEVWEAASHQQYVGRPGAVPQPYEIFLNVHKESVAARTFGALPIEITSLAPTHRFGALGVAIEDFGATGDLTLVLDCNEAVFDAAARAELAAGLRGMLEACLDDPQRGVRDPRPVAAPTAGAPASAAVDTAHRAHDDEAAIRGVWRDLLGTEPVAAADDFFALGGDSLLVYRMLARVRDELGIDVPVDEFLAHPTIAGLLAAWRSPLPRPSGIPLDELRYRLEALPAGEVEALLSTLETTGATRGASDE